MTGLAKQLFTERQINAPWKNSPQKESQQRWPNIQKLVDERFLLPIDLCLAQTLLRECAANEENALFICYLSMALRSGHLCVKIDEQELSPSLESLLSGTSDNETELQEKLHSLNKAICLGAKSMPSEVISSGKDESEAVKALHRFQNSYYFQKYWVQESSFIASYKNIISSKALLQPDISIVKSRIEELCLAEKLLPEQAAAIQQAVTQNLTIICGGPGTGKTYTAGLLIKIFLEGLTAEERRQCKIALAAPTGKAAANLQKSLARALSNNGDVLEINAKTLHSLLGINKSGKNHLRKPIKADLLLIDECSMIDANLMSKLFASITPGMRVILLGDPHQLPPVESGLVFGDLIKQANREGSATAMELITCLRAELQPIIDLADAVKKGDTTTFLRMLSQENQALGIERLQTGEELSPYKMQKHFLSVALASIPQPQSNQSPHELLHNFNRFKILTPMRHGPLGFETLNQLIVQHMRSHCDKNTPFIAPILITKNDYRLELCNGDTGILIKADAKSDRLQEGDIALFSDGEAIRSIPALLLPLYEYAYCMSVHKSQGSEFDHVIILMPEGAECFGREVLYTALTRAKKRLTIWGSDSTLTKVIETKAERQSGISERLSYV